MTNSANPDQLASKEFVCVEVLQPSQPNGVMSSVVSLPNHTFTGQAKSSKLLTSIVHILLSETDDCPSWISGRERMTVENISWSIFMKEYCRPRRGWNPRPPGLQLDAHPTEPPRPADLDLHCFQRQGISWFCKSRINHLKRVTYFIHTHPISFAVPDLQQYKVLFWTTGVSSCILLHKKQCLTLLTAVH